MIEKYKHNKCCYAVLCAKFDLHLRGFRIKNYFSFQKQINLQNFIL